MTRYEETIELLKTLAAIPAPSHHEEKRAEFCLNWLKACGGEAYVDEALNVILPIGCDGCNEITVVAAHTDVVFPDTEPFEVIDDGEKLHCPGIGDDTANLVVMMMTAKEILATRPDAKGIMFVCNSCEEGLGNLKGTRQIFADFEGRISRFISFDSSVMNRIVDCAVGSERFKITAKTQGGHSFGKFGNKNAITALAQIVCDIYALETPKKEGKKTTYNVGEICGGTSVNTIAQEASMLIEFRSDDEEGYNVMKAEFDRIFEKAKSEDGVEIEVELIGKRPSGKDNIKGLDELMKLTADTIRDVVKLEPTYGSSSTDCNIPLSLGIPAVCFGVGGIHAGSHTREEWVNKESLKLGLELCLEYVTRLLK